MRVVYLWFAFLTVAHAAPFSDEMAETFLVDYCFDCHDEDTGKGEIELDDPAFFEHRDDPEFAVLWERVKRAIDKGEMPPKDKKTRPELDEATEFSKWTHQSLLDHSKEGGTLLRRLTGAEYEETIQALFGIDWKRPVSFPADYRPLHGFDNTASGLVLSPTLMESYLEAAISVADELFPPPLPETTSKSVEVDGPDFTISYSSSVITDDGAMRLATSSSSITRSCTWPARWESKASGVYRVTVDASAFRPENGKATLQLRAGSASITSSIEKTRLLGEFEVTSDSPETFTCEGEIHVGETVIFHYADARLHTDKDNFDSVIDLMREKFEADPRLLAAWQTLKDGSGNRGGVGWQRVKALRDRPDLDLTHATLDSKKTVALLKKFRGNPVNYVETITYDHFENGPALDVHRATFEGPIRTVIDPERKQAIVRAESFRGERGDLTEIAWAEAILSRFLTAAFRRPVSPARARDYATLVTEHQNSGHTFDEGLHLAVRTALMAPEFLYRGHREGALDTWDLASRLSYFLSQRPPNDRLIPAAENGWLDTPEGLEAHAKRLLDSATREDFIASFVGQWLDTRELDQIMPEPSVAPGFNESVLRHLQEEPLKFFGTILEENLPMSRFIAPDFAYLSKHTADKIYGRKKIKENNLTRVSIPTDGRYGGLLGMGGVMMATANGVDTQPVLRGVWVLENILGDPAPEPPEAVPALTPDTTGATTPKAMLAAHRDDPNCMACHKKIDPVGFALENFNPVGRWRTEYPGGAPVDTVGSMPDGTPINDVTDLKAYVLTNLDDFSACLSEKLMTYATGRHPSYAERQEIRAIVEANRDGGFRDLLLSLIQSDTFRTK